MIEKQSKNAESASHIQTQPEVVHSTTEIAPILPTLTPVFTQSRGLMTPRKARLRKQLDFMATSNSEINSKVKALRSKLKTPKRCVNQAIHRKIEIIMRKNRVIITHKLCELLNFISTCYFWPTCYMFIYLNKYSFICYYLNLWHQHNCWEFPCQRQ